MHSCHILALALIPLCLLATLRHHVYHQHVIQNTHLSFHTAPCAPDYEACGAVPAPVGALRCCSASFFCFTRPPYFSQCRPKPCAPLFGSCEQVQCCVVARCEQNVCVPLREAWLRTRKGLQYLQPIDALRLVKANESLAKITATEKVNHFVKYANLQNASSVVATLPDFHATKRLALRTRILKALCDPQLTVITERRRIEIQVRKPSALSEIALTLAEFDEVTNVRTN